MSKLYDNLDRLSILLEGEDWQGIRKMSLEAGLGLWLIARHARVTDDETKKHRGRKV